MIGKFAIITITLEYSGLEIFNLPCWFLLGPDASKVKFKNKSNSKWVKWDENIRQLYFHCDVTKTVCRRCTLGTGIISRKQMRRTYYLYLNFTKLKIEKISNVCHASVSCNISEQWDKKQTPVFAIIM